MTRAIIVHSFDQARKALKCDLPDNVAIFSPRNGSSVMGVAYFERLIAFFEDSTTKFVLDCGNRPGDVMAALAHGIRCIVFAGADKYGKKLADMAGKYGAQIMDWPDDVLDLDGVDDVKQACATWLTEGKDLRNESYAAG